MQVVSEQYVLVPPSASVSGGTGTAGGQRANMAKVGVMPRELIVAENALESVKVCVRLSWPCRLCRGTAITDITLLPVYVILMCYLCLSCLYSAFWKQLESTAGCCEGELKATSVHSPPKPHPDTHVRTGDSSSPYARHAPAVSMAVHHARGAPALGDGFTGST